MSRAGDCKMSVMPFSNSYRYWQLRNSPSRSTSAGPVYHRFSGAASCPLMLTKFTPDMAPIGMK